ncbi:hypothetical protein KJ866_00710 [Patescibacteria group bacterium]|nr:hypothetical protein [Patescibacteria group bacterium]MBU2220048.1 hypothetical protein [Patescibacteria group bacterium]MBU2265003.1 hypothetical protein [Patescibacteria group bacterium]
MSKSVNIGQLFSTAKAEGELSAGAINALTVVDLGAQIQPALGISALDVQASEVVIVSMKIDDSGSISAAGNEQSVRDGHNIVVDALGESKQIDNILVQTSYLNGKILYPYVLLDQAKRMDGRNYQANGGTPLYDETMVLLATVMVKYLEFADQGVPARTISLIVTDGRDEHSRKVLDPAPIKKVVTEMLKKERHIIAGMGIGQTQDDKDFFRDIFQRMGLRDEWILTPDNTPSEIRKAFQVFSQSSVRASRSAASFSKTAAGGFGQ